jgi:hypothetical protein
MAHHQHDRMASRSFLLLALIALWSAAAVPQSAPPPATNAQNAGQPSSQSKAGEPEKIGPPAFKVTTRLVVVDVVARDKKDQTVNDLEASGHLC